jgi:hypothetical protein
MILCEAIRFGAIQGTLETLDVSKGSVKGLAKAIEEVDFILSAKVQIYMLSMQRNCKKKFIAYFTLRQSPILPSQPFEITAGR